MFNESLDLADVLAKLKRADESLAEFVAPLWPGVSRAAAWIEGKPRLFRLDEAPAVAGYYLLRIADETAVVVRPAEDEEARKFRGYLTKASVILLDDGLAFPASSVERLQGMSAPRPLHFAAGVPLAPVQARFDGLNLFFDGVRGKQALTPLEEIFAQVDIFAPGDLLSAPGSETAGDDAAQALDALRAHPELRDEWTLRAVVESAGGAWRGWSREARGGRVRWELAGDAHEAHIETIAAPITSGISLAGARTFDPASLSRLLHEHILDAWLGT